MQDPQTGQWWHANDDKMTLMAQPEDAVSSKAYLLFYRRRGTESPVVLDANASAEKMSPSPVPAR